VAQAAAMLGQIQAAYTVLAQSALHINAPPSITAVLGYQAQKVLMSNLGVKVMATAMLSLPLIILGGALYSNATKEPLGASMYKSYAVVADLPGADVAGETDTFPRAVLNFVFVVGLFTYAVFLGIVSDEVSTNIEAVKDSNGAVLESGHNVVLGWNQAALPMLQQAAISGAELPGSTWTRPVVVMHQEATPEFREELRQALSGLKLNVITRQGPLPRTARCCAIPPVSSSVPAAPRTKGVKSELLYASGG